MQGSAAHTVVGLEAKRSTNRNTVSNALKTGVVYGSSAVLTAVNNLTPHIAGAVDILVIEQPDGSRKATPFYVRFGKYTALRTGERNVKLYVNDELVPFGMQVGTYGQAYFATETAEVADADEDDQEALLAGIMSPPSGYSSGGDAEAGEPGETLSAVRQRIHGIKAAPKRGARSHLAGGNSAAGPVAAGPPPPASGPATAMPLVLTSSIVGGSLEEHLLLPGLSLADRNESFFSARDTLATPMGDDVVAAATAAAAGGAGAGDSPLRSSASWRQLQQARLQQQQQQQQARQHAHARVQGGSADSLPAVSEGASPCGWSEEEEEEEADRQGAGGSPCSYGSSPSASASASAVAQRLGAGGAGGAARAEADPGPAAAAAAAAAQPPEEGCPGPAGAPLRPLHQQLGFPENTRGAAAGCVGEMGAGPASGSAPGAAAAEGSRLGIVATNDAAAARPNLPGPRMQPVVRWEQVLGAGPGAGSSAAAGASAAAPAAVPLAVGERSPRADAISIAAPAVGRCVGSPCADGQLSGELYGTPAGSGSHHAVSLLSSSLRSGGARGADAPPPGVSPFVLHARFPAEALAAAPPPQHAAAAASPTAGLGSGPAAGPVASSSPTLVSLRLSVAREGGGVRARLAPAAVAAAPLPFSSCAAAAAPTAASSLLPELEPASCASEGGYLGDAEPSSSATAASAAARLHHQRHHHHAQNHSHAKQPVADGAAFALPGLPCAPAQPLPRPHGHHDSDPHSHLHSTSAPAPSSVLIAAADAAAAAARADSGGVGLAAAGAARPRPLLAPRGLDVSMCGGRLTRGSSYDEARRLFDAYLVSEESFVAHGAVLLASPDLVVRLGNGAILPWQAVAHTLLGLLAFGGCRGAPPDAPCWAPEGVPADAAAAALLAAGAALTAAAAGDSVKHGISGGAGAGGAGISGGGLVVGGSASTTPRKGSATAAAAAGGGSWRLWPFGARASSGARSSATGLSSARSPTFASALGDRPLGGGAGGELATDEVATLEEVAALVDVAAAVAGGGSGGLPAAGASGVASWGRQRRQDFPAVVVTKKSLTPAAEQLAAMPLRYGQNVIKYKLGGTELRAYVYLLPWRTRIVISDIDGTITRSDVLGHLLPAFGLDWSHPGIAQLLTNIRHNNYLVMYLSSRSISQANITRDFINTLVQGQHRMPLGPVIISPHGLLPSLYREMILRRPHEFKIATLQDIRALFPPDWNPFYGGFGNRDTDELSYREVGVPPERTFIINPRGELRQPTVLTSASPSTEASAASAPPAPAASSPAASPTPPEPETSPAPSLGATSMPVLPTALPPASSFGVAAHAPPTRTRSALPSGAAAGGSLSSLSAINQLVHHIFPPLRDGEPLPAEELLPLLLGRVAEEAGGEEASGESSGGSSRSSVERVGARGAAAAPLEGGSSNSVSSSSSGSGSGGVGDGASGRASGSGGGRSGYSGGEGRAGGVGGGGAAWADGASGSSSAPQSPLPPPAAVNGAAGCALSVQPEPLPASGAPGSLSPRAAASASEDGPVGQRLAAPAAALA